MRYRTEHNFTLEPFLAPDEITIQPSVELFSGTNFPLPPGTPNAPWDTPSGAGEQGQVVTTRSTTDILLERFKALEIATDRLVSYSGMSTVTGGWGTVIKARLDGCQEVAVKELRPIGSKDERARQACVGIS